MEEQNALGDDYKIINDKTDAAGVRHITAAPKDILLGVNCHGRGTSCTDQLARILEKQVK